MREVKSDRYRITYDKFQCHDYRNINDVSGLYPVHWAIVIGSYVKMPEFQNIHINGSKILEYSYKFKQIHTIC